MAFQISVNIKFDTQVLDKLNSETVRRQALSMMVDAAARAVQSGAMKRTPVKSGRLRSGWVGTGALTTRGTQAWLRNSVEYAAYVEEGTKPHTITPRNGRALRWPLQTTASGLPAANTKFAFAKKVNHPGTQGVHMAQRAVREDLDAAMRAAHSAMVGYFGL